MSIAPKRRVPRHLVRGFSLVELMVGMLLSLVLLAGALSILYSSKVTYSENDRLARLQEAGRTVVELILRDARATGFRGCGRPLKPDENLMNALANPNTLLWNLTQPIYGYDAVGAAFTPALDVANVPGAADDSDVIVLRTTREGTPVFHATAAVSLGTEDFEVNRGNNATVPAGQTMVANDCRNTIVFAASDFVPVSATTATIRHGAGVPGNATGSLDAGLRVDAQLSYIDTVIYYVSDDGQGPALWQKIGNNAAQRLIPGVENIQFLYGVDDDDDLLVNQYLRADQVDAANDWGKIISLTIAVLVRSEDETNLERDTRTYDMLTHVVDPPDDRRQRSLFITTVTLRNQTT